MAAKLTEVVIECADARRVDVGQGPDVAWIVLANPQGNEFCLLRGQVD